MSTPPKTATTTMSIFLTKAFCSVRFRSVVTQSVPTCIRCSVVRPHRSLFATKLAPQRTIYYNTLQNRW